MRKILKTLLLTAILVILSTTTVFAAEELEDAKTGVATISGEAQTYDAAPTFKNLEWDLILLVNEKRVDKGLKPLTVTNELQEAARTRASELSINGQLSHTRPNGTSWTTVLSEKGVRAYSAAECIARKYKSAAEFLNVWLSDSTNSKEIYGDYAHIGVGYTDDGRCVLMLTNHRSNCYTGGTINFGDGYLTVKPGIPFEKLGYYHSFSTKEGENCYLLLHSDYIKGYNPYQAGLQKTTLSFLGYTGELYIYVEFSDVKNSEYYYDPVLWAVANGITKGMSATTFEPNSGCTRGQSVTFLWRAAGCPEPTSKYNPFGDVYSSDYYYKAVLWAVEKGITNGMSATRFEPNSTCTRGQIVTFLWRGLGEPTPESLYNNPFRDISYSDYYYEPVLWAVENGVTNGLSATSFGPTRTCTRGQIVTFLYRALIE